MKQHFEREIVNISVPSNLNKCFGCSNEPSYVLVERKEKFFFIYALLYGGLNYKDPFWLSCYRRQRTQFDTALSGKLHYIDRANE